MTKELKILNDELKELKRAFVSFTEITNGRINDLLNRMDQFQEKTCDEELQEVINTARDLIEEPNYGLRDNILFDLFLNLFNVYELDAETIGEIYTKTTKK